MILVTSTMSHGSYTSGMSQPIDLESSLADIVERIRAASNEELPALQMELKALELTAKIREKRGFVKDADEGNVHGSVREFHGRKK